VWAVSIFGPYAILLARMPWLAMAASSVLLAAFALSFRWRNGYVLIIGCLGMLLLLHSTLTIGGAFALLARNAGLNLYSQIAVGLTSIPFVYLLMRCVDRAAIAILGPVVPPSARSQAHGSWLQAFD
jgi:hypothetical protein